MTGKLYHLRLKQVESFSTRYTRAVLRDFINRCIDKAIRNPMFFQEVFFDPLMSREVFA